MEGREREGPKLLLNQDPSEPCYATVPAQDLTRHISGPRNKRRSPAENWLKKTGRYCSSAQIPLGRPHTASHTKSSTFECYNVVDSR